MVKGVLSGTIIVASSEIAERSALYGALIISLPIASILAVVWLYHDTGDLGQVADYAGSILWLVLPSLVLFSEKVKRQGLRTKTVRHPW